MSLVELLAHPAARLLTVVLVHFLWQGLAIAALLAAVVQVCGVRRALQRYACSLAALGAMLLCPLATFLYLTLPGEPQAAVALTLDASPAESPQPLAAWLAPLQPAALAAWLMGVALFGGRLLAGALGVVRLRRGRLPLPLDLATLVERLGRRLAMEALPLVFVSRQVTEAMAVGLFRPLVLIPAAWVTEMPLEMLEAVIAHELAHLRRRDLWVNLLQRLAETLLFYHPAVWWLSRRLRAERELCADELAVAATGRRLEYAQALEQVAHRRRAEVRLALAAFMRGEANMRVLERVRNVLGLAGGERSRLWPVGIAALALPVVLWAAAAGLRSAVADEPKDGDKPAAKRDDGGDRKDTDRKDTDRKDTDRKDTDRKDTDRKDGERKVEIRFFNKETGERRDEPRKDEPRKDGPRDGEVKKDRPRDGEVKKGTAKKDAPRDGEVKKDRPRDGEVKKEGAKDGEPRKVVARDGEPRKDVIVLERKIAARDGEAGRIEELSALVKRLAQQVERLQAEVSELRGGKGGASEKEGVVRRLKAEAAKEAAERKEGEAKEKEAAVRRKEVILKELGGKNADVKRALGERAAEIRKIEALKERGADDKEAAARRERELIERKKAAVAEAEKRAAAEKKEAAAERKEKEEKKDKDDK